MRGGGGCAATQQPQTTDLWFDRLSHSHPGIIELLDLPWDICKQEVYTCEERNNIETLRIPATEESPKQRMASIIGTRCSNSTNRGSQWQRGGGKE